MLLLTFCSGVCRVLHYNLASEETRERIRVSDVAKIAGALVAEALELYAKKIYAVTLIAYKSEGEKVVTESVRDVSGKVSHTQSIRIGQETLKNNLKNAAQMAFVYTFVPPVFDRNYTDFRRPTVFDEPMSDTLKVLVIEFIDYKRMKHPITLGLPYEYKESGNNYDSDIEIFDIEKYYFPKGYKQSEEMTVFESFFEGIHDNEAGSSFLFDRAKSTEQRSILFYDAKLINFGSTNALFRKINKPLRLHEDDGVVTFRDGDTEIGFAVDGVTYDNINWHYGSEGSEGATEAGCCMHFAIFFIWCLFNNLGHSSIMSEVAEVRRGYMKKSFSPGQFMIDLFDGKFWSSFLNKEGNAFSKDYYESGEYYEDYDAFIDKTYPDVQSFYHVPDTWDIYDQMAKKIQARFDEWK